MTLAFLTALCIAAYIPAFYELKRLNVAYQEREEAIETAISAGQSYVEIPNIRGESGYSCYDDSGALNADSSQWPNTAMAKYYGIGEVVLGGR